jgi:hypothetical protein
MGAREGAAVNLSPDFWAAKVAEYGSDVRTMADAFEQAIKRGDKTEAQRYLNRMNDRVWAAQDAARCSLDAT